MVNIELCAFFHIWSNNWFMLVEQQEIMVAMWKNRSQLENVVVFDENYWGTGIRYGSSRYHSG